MANPWLNIPLSDYEGHMSAEQVGQLAVLAEMFETVLRECRPESLAVLGIAGGNGLDRIDRAVTRRLVGIDLNDEYIKTTRQRFPDVELHCVDLANELVDVEPVRLVHAALVFEHAGVGRCLENALAMVTPGGWLSVVLQLPSQSVQAVSPTPYASIQTLHSHFKFVDKDALTSELARRGLHLKSECLRELPAGKSFWMALYLK